MSTNTTQMSPISIPTLEAALHWRYATKQFDPAQHVSEEQLAALLRAMVLAPSSFGLQPWKFVVIADAGVKQKLKEAGWNQPQFVDASHVIVVAAKKQITSADIDLLINTTASVRGMDAKLLDGYKGMITGMVGHMPADAHVHWNARQAYIALGFLMQSAALLGIDTCPMEGIDPKKFDDILGLTNGDYTTVVACPIGHRAATDKYATAPKVRYDATTLIEYR